MLETLTVELLVVRGSFKKNFLEYTFKVIKENWKISTCNRLDLEILRSWLIMSKLSLDMVPHLGLVTPLFPPPVPRVERLHKTQIGAPEVVVCKRERAHGNRRLRLDCEPHVGRRRVEERICNRPADGRGLRDCEAVERPAGYFAAKEDGGGRVHMVSIVGVNIEGVFSFVANEEGTPQLLEWHLICTCKITTRWSIIRMELERRRRRTTTPVSEAMQVHSTKVYIVL